jgi:hypothetical protein
VYQLLSFEGAPPPSAPMAYFDEGPRAGRVLSIGSFAKVLAPGLRLGWLQVSAAGAPLLAKMAGCGQLDSSGALNPVVSGIAHTMIDSGSQAEHLAAVRAELGRRAATLGERCGEHIEQPHEVQAATPKDVNTMPTGAPSTTPIGATNAAQEPSSRLPTPCRAHGLPRLLALYAAVSATAAANAASPPALDAEVWAAIDRDVGRTLGAGEGPPPGVDGEARLRRVLVALALVDRGVAYVQGLNFMAAFALRWILMQDAVSVVIPGAKSPAQAQANVLADALPALSAATLPAARDIYTRLIAPHVAHLW